MSDTAAPASPAAGDVGATPLQDETSQQFSARLSAEQLLPPGQVPGYEIERLLGAGSYGSVWLARELKTGKQVAIKFYTQRRGLNWSLLSREVEKLALLYTSRDVVRLLDVGWDHDPPYFVMEYLERGSLESRLRAGPLPIEEAVRCVESLARALVHAHQHGILHCDVKPANVLLDANSEPRLGDFGQSRLTTELSPALGTVYYMAPEQAFLDGVPDVRWDVYALGAVLYCMLTGAPPYSSPESETRLQGARPLSKRLEVYREIVAGSPPPERHRTVPGVDHRLAEIVSACLQRDPALRPPSVQAVLDLLQARERARTKRPLIALGFLGPIVFLTAMYWIAESVVPQIVAEAEENLIDRALAGDVVTARILADSVQQELRSRQDVLERLAGEAEVRRLLQVSRGLSDQELLQMCLLTADPPADLLPAAAPFLWVTRVVSEATDKAAADGRTADDSWFITDDQGRQVYRFPPQEPDHESTLGRSFHFRDYFHGQGRELDPDTPRVGLPIRDRPGVSVPFRSQASDQYMVAIATPIRSDGGEQVIGVLARTIRLTALLHQWEVQIADVGREHSTGRLTRDRFLALGDARGSGVRLLDHPGLTQSLLAGLADEQLQSPRSPLQLDPPLAAELEQSLRSETYRDPIARLDPAFAGEWLAAAAPVGDTGWLAIVQERKGSTIQPVDNLRRLVVSAGVWSLAIFSSLLLLLWFLIRRAAV